MRISSTPAKAGETSSSTAAYTAARIESLRQTRDRLALGDLQAGKLLPFIEYAESTMDERSGDELVRWQKLLGDSKDKVEEMTVGEGVRAGDIQLEAALKFLQTRRDKHDPSDTRFMELTRQIADVKNAIEARDFNADLARAQAEMIDGGNSTAAKEKYLKTLVSAYTRAKDPTAQKALSTQIGQMRTEIQKDHVLARAQADNALLVRYYTPGSGVQGQDVLQYLSERAANAESPEEANRYASLAVQVATRERTLQTQRLRAAAAGGGGGGGGPTLASVASDIKSQTAAALAVFERSVKAGRPDDRAFMLAREATDRELNAIDAALPGASVASAKTLLARRDAAQEALINQQRSGATKLVAIEQDANTVFNQNLKDLREGGAGVEEVAKAIAARVGQISLRRSSILFDGLTNDPQTDGELSKMETITRGKLTSDAQDAARVLVGDKSDLTRKIGTEYARYRSNFVTLGLEPPVGMDEWMRLMSGSLDDETVARKLRIGVSASAADVSRVKPNAADIVGLHVERDSARQLNRERQAEVNKATDAYVAAAWPRNEATGERYPYVASPPTPSFGGTGVQPGPGASDMEKLAFLRGGVDPFEADYFRKQLRTGGMPNLPGEEPPPDQQQGGGDVGAGPLTGHAGPMAQRMNADPHVGADMFLDSFTTFDLPTWEIPSLPAFSPFAPSLDPGDLEQYAPPQLPTFLPAPIRDVAPADIGTYAPALGAGAIEPPPSWGGASSAPGESVSGPQIAA